MADPEGNEFCVLDWRDPIAVDQHDVLPYGNTLLYGKALVEEADMPEVVRSIEIPAPPSSVWPWLSTQDGLRRWLAPDVEIDLQVGGAYRMLGADGETRISGTVLELVPEGRLVLSWLEEEAGWVHPARLVVTLEPTASGTRVGLVHDGFAGIGKPGWAGTVEAYERGADKHQVLEQLAVMAATGSA